MKKVILETHLEVYESVSELPENIQDLMNKAQQARKKAYAPYSLFKVGAAILLDNGSIVTGNNQENAAFPSGLCAERVAAFYAGAEFPGIPFKALAISAGSTKSINTQPIPPCGACRQSLSEYEVNQGSPVEIYFMGEEGKVVKSSSIKALLPLLFDNSYL
ncbi:MAG: cytidine deaminase [Alteromonas sp.]|nr:cytidine deaminase [Alteromonas sp.]MAY22348.1 cytidine deaminase [Flavobacteriaceae bacterium]